MSRFSAKAPWIVSTIVHISLPSKVSRIRNEPHLPRKTENQKLVTSAEVNKRMPLRGGLLSTRFEKECPYFA
jgi:hypothetical protein